MSQRHIQEAIRMITDKDLSGWSNAHDSVTLDALRASLTPQGHVDRHCVEFSHSSMMVGLQKGVDPNRSSVDEELKTFDWHVSQMALILSSIENCKDDTGRQSEIARMRRRLDAVAQRSYRAQQIASGLHVPKAN